MSLKQMDKRQKEKIKLEAKEARAERQNLSLRVTSDRVERYKELAAEYKKMTGGKVFPLGTIADSLIDTLIEIVEEINGEQLFDLLPRGACYGALKKYPLDLNNPFDCKNYHLALNYIHKFNKDRCKQLDLIYDSYHEASAKRMFDEYVVERKKLYVTQDSPSTELFVQQDKQLSMDDALMGKGDSED